MEKPTLYHGKNMTIIKTQIRKFWIKSSEKKKTTQKVFFFVNLLLVYS